MVARAGRGLFVNPICPQTQVAHIYCYIFISVGASNFVMVLSASIDRMLVSVLYIDPSRARHLFLVTVFSFVPRRPRQVRMCRHPSSFSGDFGLRLGNIIPLALTRTISIASHRPRPKIPWTPYEVYTT